MEPIVEEFKELVGIDSASGKERAIADILTKKLQDLGFAVTEDKAGGSFGGDTGNLVAILPGTRDGSVMFCSHMDRVRNGLGIHVAERDGFLVSDGSTILAADDVSGICAILDGVRRALSSKKPHPRIEIAFTVGEEAGLFGGKFLDLHQFKSPFCFVMDSPGSLGRLVNGAPGHVRFFIKVKGKPAHAGNEPEKGINAAHILCHILDTLRDGRIDEETVSNFPMLGTGNESTNVVCAEAWAKGEARSRNLTKLSRYVDYVKEHVKTSIEGSGASAEVETEFLYRPFLIGENEPVLQTAKEALESLGLKASIEQGGGGMDANIFNASSLPSIGVATGYTKNHTFEERLELASFVRSGELVEALIARA
jgi:tripeptide aminopeptidase